MMNLQKLTKPPLIILILAFIFSSVFTACHGNKALPAFQIPETFDESKKIELTFWAKNDTNQAQVAAYKKAIADFEKFYPSVKINIRLYTDYNRIYNDVITNIATKTTPNVCITYPDHIATYRTGMNVVCPLDELISHPEYGLGGSKVKFNSVKKEEIVSKFLGECILDGKYYALPFMRSSEVCYINCDLLKKLGYEIPENLTWDFIWEASEKAMQKDDEGTFLANGQKIMIPFIYKSTDNMMIQYLAQSDAPYSSENSEILIFNDTTKEFLKEIAIHGATRSFSTFQISSYPGNFLNAGQCIFAIDSTAGASWIGCDAPLSEISEEKLVKFKTEVLPIPQVNPHNPKMISQGPSLCIFNKENPDEVLASWLFAQFLLTNGPQIEYSQSEGYVPVTLRAQNSAEYKEYLAKSGEDTDLHYEVKIKAAQILLQNTRNTFTTPVFNGSASLRNAAGQLIENTVKSVRRSEKVDDTYIEKCFSDVTSLYRLNEISSKKQGSDAKKSLGSLPATSKILLISLALVWLILIFVFIANLIDNHKNQNPQLKN